MNRSIVRFFSYLMYIVLLMFVMGGAGWLVQLLLEFTPLRGSVGTLPSSTDLVRASVLGAVSWLIGLPLVIYFYRLTLRDRKNDPQAGGGGIRAFFLNVVEACIVPITVSVAAFAVIQQLGLSFMGDMTGFASFVILSLVLVGWLEWDRRHAYASSPAALVFQRIHIYGVQLLLLVIFTSTWLWASQLVIDAVVFNSQGTIALGSPAACGGFVACTNGPNLLSLVVSALWIACFWVGYSVLAREDRSSRWYQVFHLVGLAWGFGYLLFSLERGIELLLLSFAGVNVPLNEITGPAATYDFASPLLLGLLVIGAYGFWLRRASKQQTFLARRLMLWAQATATFLLAVVFWWGIGLLLFHTFERLFGTPPDIRAWIGAVSFVVAGLAYIPLGIHLHWRSHKQQIAESLRSFVLALLSGGILAGVIGASIPLYLWGTFLLGSALDHWQQDARAGLAILLIGALIVGIYLWLAIHEHMFEWFRKRKGVAGLAAPVSVSQGSGSEVDIVLKDLLAGSITREEASARILRLIGEPAKKSLRAS